jgi:nucleotide-binding universal stress UspA family protein
VTDPVFRTIVVGYDGTAPAEHALRRTIELAGAFGAQVTVVSVASLLPPPAVGAPGAFGLLPYPDPSSLELGQSADLNQELLEQHRERVGTLFAEAGLEVEFLGLAGEPAAELIEAAEQRQADLLIVGTREPDFLDRLLGGSVSQEVGRRAPCDVLIVHPDRESKAVGAT